MLGSSQGLKKMIYFETYLPKVYLLLENVGLIKLLTFQSHRIYTQWATAPCPLSAAFNEENLGFCLDYFNSDLLGTYLAMKSVKSQIWLLVVFIA